MGLTEKYETWKKKVKDRKLFRELLDMSDEEINSAFYKDLEFGTAGIRGVMGAGTNKLNIYTIRKISQGIVLRMTEREFTKVAISYDSRSNSELFAKEAACVFAAAGINVYITKELMPTPFLSFATRRLNTDFGIMITASHNPKEYNGYKVYDSTGCQISDAEARAMADLISRVDAFRLRIHTFDFYFKKGLISYIPDKVEEDFLAEVAAICPSKCKDNLTIVYTPLCGTGYRLVPEVLKSIGCTVLPVETQSEPNGKFATCPVPNPEKKEALRYGIRELKQSNADLLIATDPDADRIGVAFIYNDDVVVLNGNEIGVLLTEYLLSNYHDSAKPVIVRTIVSTDLSDKIAENYGAEIVTVPTGFKYIGSVMNDIEPEPKRFVLGFEESQGYLAGTHVRDKDAVSTAKIIALMASELKAEGKTFADKLNEIYSKYGYYSSTQFTFTFEGEQGDKDKAALLKEIRNASFERIASYPVTGKVDYLYSAQPTNMIAYEFKVGRLLIRPSGTEPLVKFYVLAHVDKKENERIFKAIKRQFNELIPS